MDSVDAILLCFSSNSNIQKNAIALINALFLKAEADKRLVSNSDNNRLLFRVDRWHDRGILGMVVTI